MNIPGAIEWTDEQIGALDPSEEGASRAAAALGLAKIALEKYEETLDIEADYAAAAKKSAELADRFEKTRAPILDSDMNTRCPICTSYVKRTHYHCPNCGQKLRRETYKILHPYIPGQ